jgi:RNA polymerase sigma-70 factor (ECF subfamily)
MRATEMAEPVDHENPSNGSRKSISSTLLGRLRERDSEAWERLCKLYGPLVYHWCRRAGLNADDSADIFQEVFKSLSGSIAAFRQDREGDSFAAWLGTITKNKIRDHFRRQAKRPAPAGGGTDFYDRLQNIPDPFEGEQPSISVAESDGIMHRALQLIKVEFEDRTWQAFWRTTVDQRLASDVAEDLGITVNAIYKAKGRVLRRLREELNCLLDESSSAE